jgi:methylated-DNA-protein-cysteine methyltransferase-like protein
MARPSPFFARIKRDVLAIVATVPRGRLVSFRDIAGHLDISARQAAYILTILDPIEAATVPWHRAVPEDGTLRTPKHDPDGVARRALLLEEGITVSPDGRILGLAACLVEVGSLGHGVPVQARPADAPRPSPRRRRPGLGPA